MTKDSLAANDFDDMNYQTFRHDTPACLENGVSLAYSFQYSLHWVLRPASVKGVEVVKPNGGR